ncbi:MAG TPA: TetR/AcrR family transcriptional regulator [Polyangiaceae bacterium]|nr:TetR/AcrR family transcriptional regulator [Polyangiaceae bacterium]
MSSSNRPRGSYKKSETSRRQVLEAAVQALSRSGYANTSVSDIARAAGMSKGAVHYHFESKDDLIGKVLEHCARVTTERVRVAWDGPEHPAEKIRRVVAEMRDMRREGVPELRVLADLAAQGLHDARLRAMLGRIFATNRRQMVDYLTASITSMGIQSKVPVHIVPRLLMGTLDGLAMHDYFDPPEPGDDQQMEQVLEKIGFFMFEI